MRSYALKNNSLLFSTRAAYEAFRTKSSAVISVQSECKKVRTLIFHVLKSLALLYVLWNKERKKKERRRKEVCRLKRTLDH
jgi:hypothetical protein